MRVGAFNQFREEPKKKDAPAGASFFQVKPDQPFFLTNSSMNWTRVWTFSTVTAL